MRLLTSYQIAILLFISISKLRFNRSDPEVSFLSLGTVSVLRDVDWIIKHEFGYYYLGYYIHNCNKMNYKGKYQPSELLDPMTFTWVDWETAISHISLRSPFSLLSGEIIKKREEPVDKNELYIFYNGRVIQGFESFEENLVDEYIRLVGRELARSMILVA